VNWTGTETSWRSWFHSIKCKKFKWKRRTKRNQSQESEKNKLFENNSPTFHRSKFDTHQKEKEQSQEKEKK
jgi:hypothetical protein